MAKKSGQSTQVNKLQAILALLGGIFLERTEVLNGLLVGLLAREHVFMLGPPGTGKSAMSRAFSALIGGRFFEILMGKQTTKEDMYGPLRLSALQKDQHIRNTDGTFCDCVIGFLDELWKASSTIINTTLAPLNERIFHNAGPQQIPLEMCVSASNELPQGEELGAAWDRYALRFVVRRLQDDQNFKAMVRMSNVNLPTMLPLAELKTEQAKAMALPISDEILELLTVIRRECDTAGFVVSDRKWVQISRIIRAQAHVRGHGEVLAEDLDILQHVLWHDDKQISATRKLVMKHCNPIGEVLVDIRDAVTEISVATQKPGDKDSGEGMTLHNNVKKHLKKVNELMKEYPTNSSLADLQQYVSQVKKSVEVKYLGFE